MLRTDKPMIEKNLDRIFELERYNAAHPAFAERTPDNAMVALQVKGDDTFNRWSRRLGEKQAKNTGRPVVRITINKIGPVRLRIEALKVERAV